MNLEKSLSISSTILILLFMIVAGTHFQWGFNAFYLSSWWKHKIQLRCMALGMCSVYAKYFKVWSSCIYFMWFHLVWRCIVVLSGCFGWISIFYSAEESLNIVTGLLFAIYTLVLSLESIISISEFNNLLIHLSFFYLKFYK